MHIVPDPSLDLVPTRTVGFMGESLTAFLLELEFGGKGLRVAQLGDEEFPWDLFIFEPVKDTPFGRPTAIQVKSRTTADWRVGPTRDEFLAARDKTRKMGYDLWYSFVHYRYKGGHMRFGVYLVPASSIDEGDFGKVRMWGKEKELLRIAAMREKARLTFYSRKMDIEDGSKEGGEGRIALKLSQDLSGDWGENTASFLLGSLYKEQGLQSAYVGRGYAPYDIFIDGRVEGTPFDRPAAISVKANSSNWTTPSFEGTDRMRKGLDGKGIGLWLALLQYYYIKRRLGFVMCLVKADALERGDFEVVDGWAQKETLLNMMNARRKAVALVWTEAMART